MSMNDFEETYQQLHEQLLRGEIDEEEFKAEVEKLRFEDSQGQQWRIGWYTGQWYRYDQGQWVQDRPQEKQVPDRSTAAAQSHPQKGAERRRRPFAPWLAAGLVGLLLVAGAILIIGWNADWWRAPAEEAISAATSVTMAPATTRPPTTTPTPTNSPRPTPSPSSTTQPTKIRYTPTATPRAAPPTASPTETTSATPTSTLKPLPSATPALSGQIFFPVYDPNPDRRTFDIYAIQLESGTRELVVGQASQPALSPDGKRLAYRSWDRAQRGILVRELASGNTWVWINFTEAARPSWSPDGQNIVFPSQQESDRQWRLYRSLGIEFDRVRRHGGDILGRMPVWLADGRIVYWECALDKCGLYVMQKDGTRPIRLTTYEHDMAPAASPDGSQVAFMSNQSGNLEIYVVSTQTPGGQGGQELKRLTQNAARDGLPTWSPDGKWLAFVTDRDGAWAIWVMRPDGSDQRKLFELGGPLEGEIAYAPANEQAGWTWETIAWGP